MKKRSKLSLRTSMFLIFTIMIFLLAASTSLISVQKSFANINIRTNNAIDYHLLVNKGYVNSWIETQAGLIESLAQETQLQKTYLDHAALKNYLALRQKNFPYILAFYMGLADNGYIDSTDWVPPSDYIATQRDWYKQAMDSDTVIVTEPYIDADTKQLVVTVAKKVTNGNEVVGAMGMDISLDSINEVMKNSITDEGSYAFVVNSAGDVIMHPEQFYPNIDNKFQNLSSGYDNAYAPLLDSIKQGKNDRITLIDYTGEKRHFKTASITDTDWSIVLSFPTSYLKGDITFDLTRNITLLVVTIILSIIVIWWFSKKFISPIERICDNLDLVGDGKLNTQGHQINPNSLELERLNQSTQHMKDTLTAYIGEIGVAMSKLASGDLRFEVKQQYVGDFKEIGSSMVTAFSSLNRTFSEITNVSVELANEASQVSHGAQRLAEGSTEQASAVEQLSASISEISSNVALNADNSLTANNMAADTTKVITLSSTQMAELLDAMDHMNEQSSEIKKIIKTIEDIAFQTNILALNASVEAARAGSAGKGFAVVADEVRNLAGKSAQAAKDTTALIEDSVNSINKGVSLAKRTAHTLDGVVSSVDKTTSIIADIASASNSQATSVSQISLGVEQISGVIQTNSATSQESAALSAELSRQTDYLMKLISQFKLGDMQNHI